jgi:transposase-like protein
VEAMRMVKKLTFEERQQIFSDPEKARSYLESVQWPNGPVCPHCGCSEAYKMSGGSVRNGLWKCKECRKQFTVTVGTIFQGSHIPLNKWLYAVYLMCKSKKSISTNQLHRDLEIAYKSAWFMTHRIREAMSNESDTGMFDGVVEADETYVGGKTRGGKRGRGAEKKTPVFSLISRDGNAWSSHVNNVKKTTLQGIIEGDVVDTAHIMTDSFGSYRELEKNHASHEFVDHSKEYVREIVHTNFAESYFSLMRRGIVGTFHHASKEHLQRYLHEFDFRWNRRDDDAVQAVADVLRQSVGLRLLDRDSARSLA